MSGDPADHASTSRTPALASKVEANMGTMTDGPPIEDVVRISTTNSEVESAMNHRRRRATLRNPNISEEASNAFNSGDAYI